MSNKKQIQLFKPVFNVDACLQQVHECLEKGWTGIGFKTVEFEDKWKDYTGLPNAHFLNSATGGLHLACELAKRKANHFRTKIISTPMTFVATNHAILHAGAEPYFIDIDESLCMSPDALEEALKNEFVTAVMFVAFGGNIGRLDDITALCIEYGKPLIIDAAHAAGTWAHQGIHIGRTANYTVFSYQAVKNLPTADSGMICCLDKNDDSLVRQLSWLGINKDTYTRTVEGGNWSYDVPNLGWKYHGNSIMAGLAIAGLGRLEAENAIRQLQYFKYVHNLDKGYNIVSHDDAYMSSHHLMQVRVPSQIRNRIIFLARGEGVQLGVHYIDNTSYAPYRYLTEPGYLPLTRRVSREIITLPIGTHLRESDVDYVIEVMNNAWNMA